mgnify:CR=1 FL=1
MQRTEKLVTTPGTRGNIYDRNGNLLAYNQLAYAVAIQDLGDYPKAADRNAMIYRHCDDPGTPMGKRSTESWRSP